MNRSSPIGLDAGTCSRLRIQRDSSMGTQEKQLEHYEPSSRNLREGIATLGHFKLGRR
jgi:hypothetical protein